MRGVPCRSMSYRTGRGHGKQVRRILKPTDDQLIKTCRHDCFFKLNLSSNTKKPNSEGNNHFFIFFHTTVGAPRLPVCLHAWQNKKEVLVLLDRFSDSNPGNESSMFWNNPVMTASLKSIITGKKGIRNVAGGAVVTSETARGSDE
jgi:hypothetical protein